MKREIILIEKKVEEGLTKKDISMILDIYKDCSEELEFYPIELESKQHECSVMGFITNEAAYLLDYDYETSGLHDFVSDVIDDMQKHECIYEYKGITIIIFPIGYNYDNLYSVYDNFILNYHKDEIKFDEMFESEDTGTTTFYFTAPKEVFNGRYPEADSAEIRIEFPTNNMDTSNTIVAFSPTKDGEDYDWYDVYLSEDDIKMLLRLSKSSIKRIFVTPKETFESEITNGYKTEFVKGISYRVRNVINSIYYVVDINGYDIMFDEEDFTRSFNILS